MRPAGEAEPAIMIIAESPRPSADLAREGRRVQRRAAHPAASRASLSGQIEVDLKKKTWKARVGEQRLIQGNNSWV
jgi:hypothetical protein